MDKRIGALAALFLMAGCAGGSGKSQVNSALSVSLAAASAAETSYAIQPGANPATVAKLSGMLSIAQAAVWTWENSTSPADQAAAQAAIAALLAYEAEATLHHG